MGDHIKRPFFAFITHALLLVLLWAVSIDVVNVKYGFLVILEFVAFIIVQTSDPGYVDTGLEIDASFQGDRARSPLVPLEWSRAAWKPG
jgi:hypothetical protein